MSKMGELERRFMSAPVKEGRVKLHCEALRRIRRDVIGQLRVRLLALRR